MYYDSEADGINDGGDVPSKDGKYELHKADKAINSRQGASRNDLQGYTGTEAEPETPEYEYIKHEPKDTKTIPFKNPNEGKTKATEKEFKKYQCRRRGRRRQPAQASPPCAPEAPAFTFVSSCREIGRASCRERV